MASQVNFPEIDVRQRMTVSKGVGVAEIVIPEGSELVGKTIEQSGLRDRDFTVLNVHQGIKVFSNPKSSRVLEADDSLLCYGKLDSMRDLIPQKKKRKRKAKAEKLDPQLIVDLGPTD